jgi:hypothetical protein
MSTHSVIKTTLLSILLTGLSMTAPMSYADGGVVIDPSTQNLVAGFGSKAIAAKLMNQAPTGSEVTIPTNMAQATYLLSPNSVLAGSLTQSLLSRLANLGKDTANDSLSFTWYPNAKPDPKLAKDPIKSVDVNTLLQPMTYTDVEKIQAKNVIDALSGALVPLNIVNFNQLVANLSGDKSKNLQAKLNEKQIQEYLAALRSYIATQTVALGNLYQLYAERQAIDPSTLSPSLKDAVKAVTSQTKGPVSSLQLENFMATRRILDKSWYKGLVNDNPASLQREQVELLAENLAESHQTRMTLERLLATMSVLVLELNQQIRSQLQSQIQNISNPPQNAG